MRIVVSLSAGLMVGMLGACATSGSGDFSDRPPSMAVADAAMRSGSPAMALQICTDTLQREPGNLKAQLCQGDALAALGQAAPAETVYAQALQNDGRSTAALVGLARLRLSRDPAAAESLFVRAVDLDGSNAVAWNNLGIARDLQGRHLQAQIAYRRALEITPDAESVKVNLALSLAISGRANEGIQMMHSLHRDPNSDPHLRANLAAVMAMGGQYDEAARILSQDLPPDEVDQTIAGYREMVAQDRTARLTPAQAQVPASVSVPASDPGAAAAPAAPAAPAPRAGEGQAPYVVPASAPWEVGPGGGRHTAAPGPVPVSATPEPQISPPTASASPISPPAAVQATPAPVGFASVSTSQHPYVVPASAPWALGPGGNRHGTLSTPMLASVTPASVTPVPASAPEPAPQPAIQPSPAVVTSGAVPDVQAASVPAIPVTPEPAPPVAESVKAALVAAAPVQQTPYVVSESAPREKSGHSASRSVVARKPPRARASSHAIPAAAPVASSPSTSSARPEARANPGFVPPSAELPTSTSP